MAKNLIVCCDGTWNTPEQREGGQPCPTNVVKLCNLSISDDTQLKYYHPGVGTKGGIADRIFGGGLGWAEPQHPECLRMAVPHYVR
jgi:uncharacterized protein (DUF2235 family)